MSQDDLNVPNGSGATVRGKINLGLQAQATRQSGLFAPSPSYANQDWVDTNTGTLWRRNNANSGWINCGPMGQALLTAADSDVMSGTDTLKALTSSLAADLWKKGVAVPSATSLNFAGLTGRFFHVTGTTTIAGISGRTDGPPLVLIFDSSLVLTHSSAFKLPAGVPIAALSGDIAMFVNDGGDNWVCTAYQTPPPVAAATPAAYTQCRLDFISTSILRLGRRYGYLLTIDNAPRAIPVGGVDLSPAGLSPGTNYYVYAYMASGVMTLEASTTAPGIDSRNGMSIKGTDATRSLVGFFYCNSGPAFNFQAGQRWVMSFYNTVLSIDGTGLDAQTGGAAWVQLIATYYAMNIQGVSNCVVFWNGYSYNTNTTAAIEQTSIHQFAYPSGSGGSVANNYHHTVTAGYVDNDSLVIPCLQGNTLWGTSLFGGVNAGIGRWVGAFYVQYTY